MNRRTFLGSGALALAGALAGCTTFEMRSSETTRETVDAAGIDRVRVSNAVGHVTVLGDDTDQIQYRAEKRLRGDDSDFDRLTVTAARSDGVFELVGGFSGSASIFEDRGSIELEVTVPHDLVVEAVDVDVGDVTLLETSGDTVVHVGVGSIDARDVDGYLDLSTQTGDVDATGVTGLDHVSTDIGDVTVEVRGLRRDVDVTADIGEVDVRVVDALDLDLEVRGSRAESDLPLTDELRRRDRISGRLNAGGHRLRVTSDIGEARVRRL